MTDRTEQRSRGSDSHRPKRRSHPVGSEILRYPIFYSDASAADVNLDALPSPQALRGMELAYRERAESEGEIMEDGRKFLAGVVIATVIGSLVLVLLAVVVPIRTTLSLSAPVIVFLLYQAYRYRRFSLLEIVLSIVGPPAIVLLLYALAGLLYYRSVGVIVFSLLASCAMLALGRSPFRFFQEWILTHPRLTIESRKSLRPGLARSHILSTVVLVGLPFVVWVPFMVSRVVFQSSFFSRFAPSYVTDNYAWESFLRSSLAGSATSLLFCIILAGGPLSIFSRSKSKLNLLATLRYAGRLFAHFHLYGRFSSEAAGVWLPTTSRLRRLLTTLSLLVPISLMLTALTSGFAVWDIPGVRDEIVETFKANLENETSVRILMALTPSADWEEYARIPQETATEPHMHPNIRRISIKVAEDNFLEDVLAESLGVWLVVAFFGIQSGRLWMLWLLLFPLVLSLSITTFFALACARPMLKACWEFENRVLAQIENDSRPIWQCFVDRIRTSAHTAKFRDEVIRESDHLFFGVSGITDYPVLLHKPLFDEHCYIVGQTGSGKTSLGIMPLLIQLIRGSSPPPKLTVLEEQGEDAESSNETEGDDAAADNGNAQATPRVREDASPVVIIDLKGDPALFHTIRAEAEARGQEFRFFTPERGLATHVFNPFSNFSAQNRSLLQVCQLLLDALGLNHGEGYGRSYFTRQNREALFDALNSDPAAPDFQGAQRDSEVLPRTTELSRYF